MKTAINTRTMFDPKTQQPIPSEDCPEFSVDVFIIDEKEMHGLACYHFEDKKWIFHTDTLVDYNEKGAETQWRWYYPDVQWREEVAAVDFKALYLEGRELLELSDKARELAENLLEAIGDDEKELKAEREYHAFYKQHTNVFIHKINKFLTNHKDGE